MKLDERFQSAVAAFNPLFEHVYDDEWEWRQKDCSVIGDMAGGHPSLREFLAVITIDHSVDKKGAVNPAQKEEEDPVTITTVHSAKGLEWKHVHIPSFIHGHMPSMFAEGEDDMAEEHRVFYVAVTRAKDTLTFYRPVEDGNKGFMLPESPYEQLVSPYIARVTASQAAAPFDLAIGGGSRIDLRNRLMGGKTVEW